MRSSGRGFVVVGWFVGVSDIRTGFRLLRTGSSLTFLSSFMLASIYLECLVNDILKGFNFVRYSS